MSGRVAAHVPDMNIFDIIIKVLFFFGLRVLHTNTQLCDNSLYVNVPFSANQTRWIKLSIRNMSWHPRTEILQATIFH